MFLAAESQPLQRTRVLVAAWSPARTFFAGRRNGETASFPDFFGEGHVFTVPTVISNTRRNGLNFLTKGLLHSVPPIRLLATKSLLDAVISPHNSTCPHSTLDDYSTDQVTSKTNVIQNDDEIQKLTETWRDTPAFHRTLLFPCWRVEKQRAGALETILKSSLTQPYLVTREELWEHVRHGRAPRVIQDDPKSKQHKLVLLEPKVPPFEQLPPKVQQILRDGCVQTTDKSGNPLVFQHTMRPADFEASYILEVLLPPELHPPPASFETVGHVAHLNLKKEYLPYRYLIGQVLLETLDNNLQTVINKMGEVSGPYRTYSYEILATTCRDPDRASLVDMVEWGIRLQFDLRDVYWCSRLSEERKRLVLQEFEPGQWIADPFCGIGALLLQAALHKQCIITANDWNPAAIAALKRNAQNQSKKLDLLKSHFHYVSCGDAYEFLMSLGIMAEQQQQQPEEKESRPKLPSLLPHHVVMNYPLNAASFLGALRWWPVPNIRRRRRRRRKSKSHQSSASEEEAPPVVPRVHVYTFAKEIVPNDKNKNTTNSSLSEDKKEAKPPTVEEMAVAEIASHLLPAMTGEEESKNSKRTRWQELDDFGCNVRVHNVRDVAPGKVVMCVSFSATERLLRSMQGDYSSDDDDDEEGLGQQ